MPEPQLVFQLVEQPERLRLRVNAVWPIASGTVVSVGDEGRFTLSSGDVILLNAVEFSVSGEASGLGVRLAIEYGADDVILEALAENIVVTVQLDVGQARLTRTVTRATGRKLREIARCFAKTPAPTSP